MAKELPYFKFEPSAWENGNIQLCSFELQGIFISICSMYWQRLGELPYKLALQKICGGNATALQSLCEANVIKVIGDNICIDFLNEQLSEFESTRTVNSKNARSGWEKRRKDATPMRPHSDPNAIRGEEIREERENTITHGAGKYFIQIPKKYTKDKVHKIYSLKDYFTYTNQIQAFIEAGWVHFDEFVKANTGKVFNEPDHVYNSFRQFCIAYVPPSRAPNEFINAEVDLGNLTREAWMDIYGWHLKNNEKFRNHFNGKLQVSKSMGG